MIFPKISPDEVAVCNLASIALNMFVDSKTKTFDFARLHDVTKVSLAFASVKDSC